MCFPYFVVTGQCCCCCCCSHISMLHMQGLKYLSFSVGTEFPRASRSGIYIYICVCTVCIYTYISESV